MESRVIKNMFTVNDEKRMFSNKLVYRLKEEPTGFRQALNSKIHVGRKSPYSGILMHSVLLFHSMLLKSSSSKQDTTTRMIVI